MARVQLELTDREMHRLEYIMHACDLKTRKDLFGNAFTALEWMVGETRAGRKVFSMREDGEDKHVLSLPALQNVEVMTNNGFASGSEKVRSTETSPAAVQAGRGDFTDPIDEPLSPKVALG